MEISLSLAVALNDLGLFQGLPAREFSALRMLDDCVDVLVVGGFDDV